MSTSNPTLTQQLATLSSLLSTLDSARSSLPSLLRSFNLPANSPQERATLYRQYSQQCTSNVTSFAQALSDAQPILALADKSEATNGSHDVVLKPRVKQDDGWDTLAKLMTGQTGDHKGKGKASEFENVVLAQAGPAGWDQLRGQVDEWASRNNKVGRVMVIEATGEVKFEVRGVMRVVLLVGWTEGPEEMAGASGATGDEEHISTCQVERVACFGLKEDRSGYLQSQHSLHQALTNQAMALLEHTRQRPAYASHSNLEEVLTFLSNPPLPF